jgi:hypothetical protein
VDSISQENLGVAVVHPHWDRNNQCSAWQAQTLVNLGREIQFGGHSIELGQGRPKHRGIVELGFLCHPKHFLA